MELDESLLSLPCLAGMYELSCQHNPLVIDVTHSQEDPSPRVASVLLNFSSPLVGIAAVALRTLAQPGSSDPLTTCLLQHEEGCGHQCYRYGLLRARPSGHPGSLLSSGNLCLNSGVFAFSLSAL